MDYQITTASAADRAIGVPTLHAHACANSGMFEHESQLLVLLLGSSLNEPHCEHAAGFGFDFSQPPFTNW